jgi:hypothetical protein
MSKSKIIILTGLIILAFGVTVISDAVAEEKAKGRYLVIWEMDQSKIPIDPKTRQAAWTPLVAMVKQDIQTGLTISWGAFVGEARGYTVMEGTVQEVHDAIYSRGRNAGYPAPPALGIEIQRAHEKGNSFLGDRRFQLRGK